jgi:hypothetical protein
LRANEKCGLPILATAAGLAVVVSNHMESPASTGLSVCGPAFLLGRLLTGREAVAASFVVHVSGDHPPPSWPPLRLARKRPGSRGEGALCWTKGSPPLRLPVQAGSCSRDVDRLRALRRPRMPSRTQRRRRPPSRRRRPTPLACRTSVRDGSTRYPRSSRCSSRRSHRRRLLARPVGIARSGCRNRLPSRRSAHPQFER